MKKEGDLMETGAHAEGSSRSGRTMSDLIADQFLQQMDGSTIRTFDETRINFIGGSICSEAVLSSVAISGSQMSVSIHTGATRLSSIFDIILSRINRDENSDQIRHRIARISTICFRKYSFDEFPGNGCGEIFTRISHCIISNCQNLSSIREVLKQFPRLESLDISFCPKFKAIGDFAVLSDNSLNRNLSLIKFEECGLEVSSNKQDWDDGFEGLSTVPISMEIIIKSCEALESLPPSIEKLQNLQTLILDKLPKLIELPSTLGNIQSLALLSVIDVGLIRLPPEIGRLNNGCLVHFACSSLVYPPRCYRGSLRAMRKCFAISRLKAFYGFVRLTIMFSRARKRANERLFTPGGRGYKRARDHFESTSNKQSKT